MYRAVCVAVRPIVLLCPGELLVRVVYLLSDVRTSLHCEDLWEEVLWPQRTSATN